MVDRLDGGGARVNCQERTREEWARGVETSIDGSSQTAASRGTAEDALDRWRGSKGRRGDRVTRPSTPDRASSRTIASVQVSRRQYDPIHARRDVATIGRLDRLA